MKKKFIPLILLAALTLQLTAIPVLSYNIAGGDIPQFLVNALCSDRDFISKIDEISEDSIDAETIELKVNSPLFSRNGSYNPLDDDGSSVVIHEDAMYAPLRAMADILSYEVGWDSETSEAYIINDDETVAVPTEPDAAEDGELQGVLIDGKTYAPIEEIADAAGYQTSFSGDEKARLTNKFSTGRLFVKLTDTDVLTDTNLASAFSDVKDIAINPDGLVFASFPTEEDTENAYNSLSSLQGVVYAEPDTFVDVSFDSRYTWGTEACNVDNFVLYNPEFFENDEEITVGIIDSGLNAVDPVFNNRVIYDPQMPSATDSNGHGTHVAGIIASFTQGIGDRIKLCPYRLEVEADGSFSHTTVSNMYKVIQLASKHDIINMSLSVGDLTYFKTLSDAVKAATNTLFVVSAGNEDTIVASESLAQLVSQRANGIVVTAVDINNIPASFSNYGPYQYRHSYIAAPGVDVWSTYALNGYSHAEMSGTSQAAPHVSAACALLYALSPDSTPANIKGKLFEKHYVVPEGWNPSFGVGVLRFDDVEKYGSFGNGFTWEIVSDTMTITGSGELPAYVSGNELPWERFINLIKHIELSGDISDITLDKFGNLPYLETVDVSDDNSHYLSSDGVLYTKDGTTLLKCPPGMKTGEYVIRDGTVTISDGAFSGCKDIINFVMPNTVTHIGKDSFSGCTGVSSIFYKGYTDQWDNLEKPEGWDETLGTESWEKTYSVGCNYSSPDYSGKCGDTAVWKVWEYHETVGIYGRGEMYDLECFPDGPEIDDITKTSAGWFEHRNIIKNVSIQNGITTIGKGAFACIDNVSEITLPDSVTTARAFAFGNSLKTLTLSENFKTFDGLILSENSELNNIYTDEDNMNFSSKDGVLYNKDGSELIFYPGGRLSTTFYAIPDGVKKIGPYAFKSNFGLKRVNFCDGLEEIGTGAFETANLSVLSDLPPSLKTIGDDAFRLCINMTTLALPEGVETIGNNAFDLCNMLSFVYLPKSLKKLGSESFSSCPKIKDFRYAGTEEEWNKIEKAPDWNLLSGNIQVQYNAGSTVSGSFGDGFTWTLVTDTGKLTVNGTGEMPVSRYNIPWDDYTEAIVTAEISDGITTVGPYAFDKCSALETVHLPDSLTEIYEQAFGDCYSLKAIDIPDGVKTIGEYAFHACHALKTVNFADSVTEIGIHAFSECISLTDIDIPAGMTTIDNYIFYDCHSLRNVTFRGDVTYIGYSAFSKCYNLENIVLPGSLIELEANVFYSCTGLKSLILPDSLEIIGEYVFANCTSLTEITLPKSLKTIGKMAFNNCYYLDNIYYKGASTYWSKIQKGTDWDKYVGIYTSDFKYKIHYGEENHYTGVLENGIKWTYWLGTRLLEIEGSGAIPDLNAAADFPWNSYNGLMKHITISEGITYVGNYAFSGYTALESVSLPSTLTRIGDYAFESCSALTEITIPDEVTSVGNYAFSKCSLLSRVSLPDKLTTIGNSAFASCHALGEINFPDSLESIGNSAFSQNRALKNLLLPESLTNLGNYAFSYASVLESITLPGGLTEIKANTFYYCPSLKTVSNGVSVKSVGDSAFYNCSLLTSVSLSDGISSIGNSAFLGCTSLEEIPVGNSIISIGEYAFSGCSLLTEVVIPDTLTSLGSYAFERCSSLQSVILPNKLEVIPEGAFANCTALEKVTIPASVKTIQTNAFYYCKSLTDICYRGTNAQWPNITFGYSWNLSAGNYTVHYEGGIVNSGSCGSELFWEFIPSENLLKISGNGPMTIWQSKDRTPWYSHENDIFTVEISEGVTYLGSYSFYGYAYLSKITLPKTLTDIGSYVFYNCTSLADIYYGGTPNAWSKNVSKGTSWAYNTGKGTESGTYTVYYGEENSYTGTFGDGLTWTYWETRKHLDISGKGAMPDWEYTQDIPWRPYMYTMVSVTIDDGITNVGSYAFQNASSLESVTIPDSVTTIGENAFYYCRKIKDFTLPSKIKEIGAGAFRYSSLTGEIIFDDGLTTIGSEAFYACSHITSVTIPISSTSIGSGAFGGCAMLSDIYYAGSSADWEKIQGPAALIPPPGTNTPNKKCTVHFGMSAIYTGSFGDGLTWTFREKDGTLVIEGSGNMPDWDSSSDTPWAKHKSLIQNVETGKNIEYIGNNAFREYTAIRTLNINGAKTSIGEYAFYGCSALEALNGSPAYIGDYAFYGCSALETLNGSPACIGDYAFYGCSALETLNGSPACIGDYAFYGCSALKTLHLLGSIDYIGASSFRNCILLSDVVLPDALNTLGPYAFYGCTALESITVPEGVSIVSEYAFTNCSSLRTVKLPTTITAIGQNAFSGCTSLIGTEIPHNTETLGKNAFLSCSSLESITIPAGISLIPENAFSDCSSLESVHIPASVTEIHYNAFKRCYYLADIYFGGSEKAWSSIENSGFNLSFDIGSMTPDGTYTVHFGVANETTGKCGDGLTWSYDETEKILTISGTGDMYDWTSSDCAPWDFWHTEITTVVMENGVTNIGDYAFSNLYMLTSVQMSDKVTSIGDCAFRLCNRIKSINLPITLESIGKSAFDGCSYLGDIYYGGNNVEWENISKGSEWDNNTGSFTTDGTYAVHFSGNTYYTGTYGDNLTWEFFGGEQNLLKISGTGEMYDWQGPEKNIPWYNIRKEVERLEIDSGITTIGDRTFLSLSKLTDIRIPSTVKTIGSMSFSYCTALREIALPEGIETIGNGSFAYCSALESITIPSSVTYIDDWAFSDCTALTEVSLDRNIRYIGDSAFMRCRNLESIYFSGNNIAWDDIEKHSYWDSQAGTDTPNGKYTIHYGEPCYYGGSCGDSAMWQFDEEAKLLIITGTGEMSDYSKDNHAPWYEYIPDIHTIEVSDGIKRIGKYAFYFCHQAKEVIISDSVTVIDDGAFFSCSALADILLPKSVTTLGERALFGCSSLTGLTLPKSIKSIGTEALEECINLAVINYEGSQKDWASVTKGTSWDKNTGSKTENAAYTITYGEENHYSGSCGTGVTWDLWETQGILTIKGNGKMSFYTVGYPPWYNYRSFIKSVVIENGVTNIADYAFAACTALGEITIPESVTSIGIQAFRNTAIKKITLPSSLETLSKSAFSNCSALEEITIPEGITVIGEETFRNCSSLSKVTLPETVTTIDDYAFAYCSALTKIILPAKLRTIGEYAFTRCNALGDIYYGSDSESWKNVTKDLHWDYYAGSATANKTYTMHYTGEATYSGTFGNNLKWEVWEDKNLLRISGTGATPNWTSASQTPWYPYRNIINKIEVTKGITSLGNYTFSFCIKAVEIFLPETVTQLGTHVFYNCMALKKINLPSKITKIQNSAFSSCKALESIKIPDGVTTIDTYGFSNCSKLREIYLPASLKSFGSFAMSGCPLLSDIYYTGTETQWNSITKGGLWDNNAGSGTTAKTYTVHYNYSSVVTGLELDADSTMVYITLKPGITARLAVAAYNTNGLKDIRFITVTESTEKILGQRGLGLSYSSGDTVKAFLLDTEKPLVPLCKEQTVVIP